MPSPDELEKDQIIPLIEGAAWARKADRRRLRTCLLPCATITTIFLLSLLFGTIALNVLQSDRRSTSEGLASDFTIMRKPCGSTPGEARAKGCHFDVISFNWLPTECYDAELSQSFDIENQLEWFLDPNRTQPVSHEQIMTGEFTGLYVDWEYHLRHCTAMWKKMHRAVLGDLGKRAIDSYIGSYEHTKHCEHMLLGDRSIAFDVINTRIAVKYPDCGV